MVGAAAIAEETRDAPRGVREMTIGMARLGTGWQWRGSGGGGGIQEAEPRKYNGFVHICENINSNNRNIQ